MASPVFLQREISPCQIWGGRGKREKLSSRALVQRLSLAATLTGHQGCVNTITFTATARYLLTGSDDLQLMLWDAESHKKVLSCSSGHYGNVFCARTLPQTEDDLVVSCAADGQVRSMYLSRQSGKRLSQHRGRAHKLALDPERPTVFSSTGEDGMVRQFDVREEKVNILLRCESDKMPIPLNSIAYCPTNFHFFAIAGGGPSVRVYDKRKCKNPYCILLPESFKKEKGGVVETDVHVTGLAYSNDGLSLVATLNDDDIYLFEVAAHGRSTSSSPTVQQASGDSYLSDSERKAETEEEEKQDVSVSAARKSGGLSQSNTESNNAMTGSGSIKNDPDWANNVHNGNKDGKGQAAEDEEKDDDTSSRGQQRRKRRRHQLPPLPTSIEGTCGSYTRRFTGHMNSETVKMVNFFGPNSEYVVSGSDCGHIFLWDTHSGELVHLLKGDNIGAVNCIEPHPSLPILATSGLQNEAKVWEPLAAQVNDMKGAIEVMERNRLRRDSAPPMVSFPPALLFRLLGLRPLDGDVSSDDDIRLWRDGLRRSTLSNENNSSSTSSSSSSAESSDSSESFEPYGSSGESDEKPNNSCDG